jgi:hypothetical protein
MWGTTNSKPRNQKTGQSSKSILFKTERGTAYMWKTTNSKPRNRKNRREQQVNTL